MVVLALSSPAARTMSLTTAELPPGDKEWGANLISNYSSFTQWNQPLGLACTKLNQASTRGVAWPIPMKNAFSIPQLTARWRTWRTCKEAPKADRVYDLIRSDGDSPCRTGTLQSRAVATAMYTWYIAAGVSLRVQPTFNMPLFLFCFVFSDPPGDSGTKRLSSIHFRLCTSFCPSAKRRLGVHLAPSVKSTPWTCRPSLAEP